MGVCISILDKLKHLLLKSLTGALIVCGNAADCTNYAGGDNGEAAGGSERWCGLLFASRSLTRWAATEAICASASMVARVEPFMVGGVLQVVHQLEFGVVILAGLLQECVSGIHLQQ